MRLLYSLIFRLLLPLIFVRLWWRGRHQPSYRKHYRERMGFCPFRLSECVWLHVVSLGESVAAKPIIDFLLEQDLPLLITNTTATGRDYISKNYGNRVHHCYFPYDLNNMIHRLVKRINPKALIMMETELWPNLLRYCKKNHIPTLLLNGRMSSRSATRYAKWPSVTKPLMQAISIAAVQTDADKKRFVELGVPADQVYITGSIKFDLQLPDDLQQRAKALQMAIGNRPTWIAASTHAGEEALVLDAHQQVLECCPNALLILVPRHPDRFDDVADILTKRQASFVRRSKGDTLNGSHTIFLGDTTGELLTFFHCAQISFVGGSFVSVGGHNPLEPAAVQVGSLTGPHIHNFQRIFTQLIDAKGAIMVQDADDLAKHISTLLTDKKCCTTMGKAAQAVLNQHRGATQRVLPLIETLIKQTHEQ